MKGELQLRSEARPSPRFGSGDLPPMSLLGSSVTYRNPHREERPEMPKNEDDFGLHGGAEAERDDLEARGAYEPTPEEMAEYERHVDQHEVRAEHPDCRLCSIDAVVIQFPTKSEMAVVYCDECGHDISQHDDNGCTQYAPSHGSALELCPCSVAVGKEVAGELVPVDQAKDLAELLPQGHREAFGILRTAVVMLDELATANKFDLDGLARAEVMIETIRRDLATVLDGIRSFMYEASKSYQFTIEGVGTYERTKLGSKDEWDNDAVKKTVAQIVRESNVDPETGEILEDWVEHTIKVLDEFASLKWRVTPFKDRGINVSKEGLREKVGGRDSVRRLTPGEK